MTTGEKYLQIKCGVNTRMPLEQRLLPIQGTSSRALKEAPAPRSAFLQRRHPVESTYNASLRSAVQSAADIPPRGRAFDGFDIDTKVPPLPASTQRDEFAAGATISGEQLGFYSRVRRLEQGDLDRLRDASQTRNTKRSATQHTIDVLRKREMDPSLHPPKLDFSQYSVKSRSSSNGQSGRGGGRVASADTGLSAQLDRVKNFPVRPATTYTTEYLKPHELIPSEIPDKFSSQRSVLSDFSSGGDMFRGTPKSVPAVALPLYMGHVPQHERNYSKILGAADILRPHSKCTVNLASSTGVSSQSKIRDDRSDVSIGATMMGFYTLQAVRSSNVEKSVNRRVS